MQLAYCVYAFELDDICNLKQYNSFASILNGKLWYRDKINYRFFLSIKVSCMYLPLPLDNQCKAVTGVQKGSSTLSSKWDFGKHSDNFIIDHKLLTD